MDREQKLFGFATAEACEKQLFTAAMANCATTNDSPLIEHTSSLPRDVIFCARVQIDLTRSHLLIQCCSEQVSQLAWLFMFFPSGAKTGGGSLPFHM